MAKLEHSQFDMTHIIIDGEKYARTANGKIYQYLEEIDEWLLLDTVHSKKAAAAFGKHLG